MRIVYNQLYLNFNVISYISTKEDEKVKISDFSGKKDSEITRLESFQVNIIINIFVKSVNYFDFLILSSK